LWTPRWRRIGGRLIFFPGTVLTAVVLFWFGRRALERVVVATIYGEGAYRLGLRILNKHSFSNGGPVPGWVIALFVALAFFDFLVVVLVGMIGAWVAREDLMGWSGPAVVGKRRLGLAKGAAMTSTLPEKFRGLADEIDRRGK